MNAKQLKTKPKPIQRVGKQTVSKPRRLNSKQKKSIKAEIIAKYGSYCWWCGCFLPDDKQTLDHLVPLSLGGSNLRENQRLVCKKCNEERKNSYYPPGHVRSNLNLSVHHATY
jgi:5-methylcytosine-specific restriction endonuclease McrA